MSFNTLAPYYPALEFVIAGKLLHQCRTAFLQEAKQARDILLLGEGPGRYLVELLRANPQCLVTCLDASARMLQVARRRLQAARLSEERVDFICTDAISCSFARIFDLVSTHFFLDCFRPDQLAAIVPRVASFLTPDATWVVSDFRVPVVGWQRVRAQLVLKAAYLFFRWTTGLSASSLTAPGPFLHAQGFRLTQRRVFHHGLLYAELWKRHPNSEGVGQDEPGNT